MALVIGATGVVFGDIGTSPIYTIQTIFTTDHHAVRLSEGNVFGIISLIFWVITITVSVKYVLFIMRVDNEGEGGIMALLALIQRASIKSRRAQASLVIIGILGASLFYGDAIITPAISVISSAEGLDVISPSFSSLVVPLTIVILFGLFLVQRRGTGAIGRLFGPTILVWFVVLAAGGLAQILAHPGALRALLPTYGARFIAADPALAFLALGFVVLAVTGAEALYADMGHFGKRAIRLSWFLVAFPALTLNYVGQGALILAHPGDLNGVIFLLYPSWAHIPFVILACVATIIASQAVISGAYSLSRQAVQLGFLPRLSILHTSETEGQIYLPAVNWLLFTGVMLVVLAFRSSERLASAYGLAVTGTFITTTILFLVLSRVLWKRSWAFVVPVGALLLMVDVTLFAANVRKVPDGGWLPLLIGLAMFTVLTTWQRGRGLVTKGRGKREGPLGDFVASLPAMRPSVRRVPGTAVYLHGNPKTTPLAMRTSVEHSHVLHRHVVILTTVVMPYPHLDLREWLTIDDLGCEDEGIVGVTARLGFQDKMDVPALMRLAVERGLHCRIDQDLSYFVSRINIERTDAPGLARWRKRLFVALSHQASPLASYFGTPDERTVTMGSTIRL
jgi:KUP system potassium uptake protein